MISTFISFTQIGAILFAFTQSLLVAALSLFFVSIGPPIVVTMSMGLVQLLAPLDMRARLISLFIMLGFGLQPFAALLVGYSAEVLTTPITIEVYGVLLAAAPALLLLRPALRQWEVRGPTQPAVITEMTAAD
jgi:hypothetical protein